MISWLHGQRIDNWRQSLRQGIVLACSGVGYEIQLLPRHLALINSIDQLTLWIHQVKRDDADHLYGFQTRSERDLFRILIGVSGVGPQMAIALLEQNQIDELVTAIIHQDIHKLSKAQGIGKRTAERLSIELRNKLSEFSEVKTDNSRIEGIDLQKLPFKASNIIELQETLRTLGYDDIEINSAIQAMASEAQTKSTKTSKITDLGTSLEGIEGLLKASLIWLSNESRL
ncbi:Holliday junction branch migration protein RuvA [Prochlorococcus sp. MIT 1307]|uniref:Holliday junction branch migration protein RuvA n=1 Tax=Prochlorococcus sp. MIT 1307 TaxID=3096219 RepID=UPI002A75D32D|nr:Holliday junction branch migration protein RuvA [Prochlorococcus sp. MIT 1307]